MGIHPVQMKKRKGKTWCGPSALTAITGKSYEECERMLMDRTGKDRILSTPRYAVLGVLRDLGFSHRREASLPSGCTFAAWHKKREHRTGLYLLIVGKSKPHLVVTKGDLFVDNWTKTPTFIGKAPHRRKRVTACWLITK